MVFGIVFIENVYAVDKCLKLKANLNKQTDKILKNINSLKTCIKPASRYRFKSCIKRKQEGSKGFNCFPELAKAFNSNKKSGCEIKFNNINRLLQHLLILDENNNFCLELGNK